MLAERKFILEHKLAPGDVVATTALVRDIKLTYGDRYAVDFRTNFPAIYENNPYLTPIKDNDPKAEKLKLCYKAGISMAGRGNKLHFITYFHIDFKKKTGIDVAPLMSKPDLHLSDYEKSTRPIKGRYWLVFGGGKSDMTTKHWDYGWYQRVVDGLRPYGLRFVQSGATKPGHTHPPLNNALNLVGWGWVRQMMWQIYHADGVICPITCAMHMAAAFDKPCVVIAGGREEPWWEAYVNDYKAFGDKADPVKVPHKYLHTLGQLECCLTKGCWKKKIVPDGKDHSICRLPAARPLGMQPLPKCMEMITPDHVIEAVLSYYEDGYLPPIGTPEDVRQTDERE